MSLQKHLKQCQSCTAPPFYVLVSTDYEELPTFCPFCGSEETIDYSPKTQEPSEDEEE